MPYNNWSNAPFQPLFKMIHPHFFSSQLIRGEMTKLIEFGNIFHYTHIPLFQTQKFLFKIIDLMLPFSPCSKWSILIFFSSQLIRGEMTKLIEFGNIFHYTHIPLFQTQKFLFLRSISILWIAFCIISLSLSQVIRDSSLLGLTIPHQNSASLSN